MKACVGKLSLAMLVISIGFSAFAVAPLESVSSQGAGPSISQYMTSQNLSSTVQGPKKIHAPWVVFTQAQANSSGDINQNTTKYTPQSGGSNLSTFNLYVEDTDSVSSLLGGDSTFYVYVSSTNPVSSWNMVPCELTKSGEVTYKQCPNLYPALSTASNGNYYLYVSTHDFGTTGGAFYDDVACSGAGTRQSDNSYLITSGTHYLTLQSPFSCSLN